MVSDKGTQFQATSAKDNSKSMGTEIQGLWRDEKYAKFQDNDVKQRKILIAFIAEVVTSYLKKKMKGKKKYKYKRAQNIGGISG